MSGHRYARMRSVADRVLVRPENDEHGEQVTPGGIIKPSTRHESKPMREGVVLSTGPLVAQVRKGDRVMWPTPAGDFADGAQGYELMSLRELDISLVLGRSPTEVADTL